MLSKLTLLSSGLLFVVACLFPKISYSSGIILDATNLDEVVDELQYLHAEEMSISVQDVKSFLNENNQGNIISSLAPPLGEVQFEDDSSISFNWEGIPGASDYEIRFINLNSGRSGSAITPKNKIQFDLSNSLYLFTFQSRRGPDKGPSWIIIEDKPLGFYTDIDDCLCIESSIGSNKVISVENQLLYPVPSGIYEKTVIIESKYFKNDSELIVANYILKLYVSEEGLYKVVMPTQPPVGDAICLENTDSDASYIYILSPDVYTEAFESNRMLKFIFDQESIRFRALNGNTSGNVYVHECFGFGNNNNASNRLKPKVTNPFPNPTNARFSIDVDLEKYAPTSIYIQNALGQVLKNVQPEMNDSRLEFNLSNYPNGTYYLHLQAADEVHTYPIMKLE